ncbi:MAG TPA: hypothetical protein VHU40_08830 [Polyangia bacterium]|nr:hypothetical protein [Polyangia bacterium]
MATQAVGEDIEALCGKCGQVWHVVMAKVGTRIAKVVCKRCHGQHLYRTETPDGPVLGDRPASSGARRATRVRTPEVPEPAPIPSFDPSKPPRPYNATASFTAGERVNHPTFGVGVVTGSPGEGKVEVAFPTARRVLASAKKPAAVLERPTLARHVPIADRPPEKTS